MAKASNPSTLRSYYLLVKPGIVRGNIIAMTAGFFLASQGSINIGLFLAAFSGLALIIASGCVVNNYIDRDIDSKMKRTQQRALAQGTISNRDALLFATVMVIAGSLLLIIFTNLLTLLVALTGYFFYVVAYSLWTKRQTVHGTVVGSISGAVPPVVGYVAVSNQIDLAAALLFLILVAWQMPHFYAIAIFRSKDYKAAGVPVLPLVHGVKATVQYSIVYIVAFIAAAVALSLTGYTGYVYLIIVTLLGLLWLRTALNGFEARDPNKWAGKLFGQSLMILTITSFLIAINAWIP